VRAKAFLISFFHSLGVSSIIIRNLCSDYEEARALAALEEQIPQYFVFWSYAEHGRLVKYSERVSEFMCVTFVLLSA
jgi:hypothetical protein